MDLVELIINDIIFEHIDVKKNQNKIIRLNYSQINAEKLCKFDDLGTTICIDTVLGFRTHKMLNQEIFIPENVQKQWLVSIAKFKIYRDNDRFFNEIVADNWVKRNFTSIFATTEQFRTHLYTYLNLLNPESGIKIIECSNYSKKGGKVVSTKDWEKNETIEKLMGTIAVMSNEEVDSILITDINDFSVMKSERTGKSLLWLGPAAYINHDCNPNVEFVATALSAKIKVLRKINKDEEILVNYGNSYFDDNNSTCECLTW